MQERAGRLLSLAVVGMAGYGLYSAGLGTYEALVGHQIDLWASASLMVIGLVLTAAAVLVRLLVPGGLAFALGAMLALQALALHNDLHFYGAVTVSPQVTRGAFALLLAVLAFVGGRTATVEPAEAGDR